MMHQPLAYLSLTLLLTASDLLYNPDDPTHKISVECNRAKWYTNVALYSQTCFTVMTFNYIELEDVELEMLEVKRRYWQLPFNDGSYIKEVKVAAESELIYVLNDSG